MESYRLLLALDDASAAGSLATWLRRQGFEVSVTTAPERMGAIEVVCIVVGSSVIRALASVVREWIRAHRTTISIELKGRGRFTVEGTTDIDELVRLLEETGLEQGSDD